MKLFIVSKSILTVLPDLCTENHIQKGEIFSTQPGKHRHWTIQIFFYFMWTYYSRGNILGHSTVHLFLHNVFNQLLYLRQERRMHSRTCYELNSYHIIRTLMPYYGSILSLQYIHFRVIPRNKYFKLLISELQYLEAGGHNSVFHAS